MDNNGLGALPCGTGLSSDDGAASVSTLRASIPSAVALVTQREIIRGVPGAWRKQYGWENYLRDADRQAIQKGLDALDTETCTPDDIAQIIGNRSWSDNGCDLCGEQDCDIIVRLGEEPDYEARWQDVCLPCLVKLGTWAAQAIEAATADETRSGSAEGESAVPEACAPTPAPKETKP